MFSQLNQQALPSLLECKCFETSLICLVIKMNHCLKQTFKVDIHYN